MEGLLLAVYCCVLSFIIYTRISFVIVTNDPAQLTHTFKGHQSDRDPSSQTGYSVSFQALQGRMSCSPAFRGHHVPLYVAVSLKPASITV